VIVFDGVDDMVLNWGNNPFSITVAYPDLTKHNLGLQNGTIVSFEYGRDNNQVDYQINFQV
jgi:hypothetical protein